MRGQRRHVNYSVKLKPALPTDGGWQESREWLLQQPGPE